MRFVNRSAIPAPASLTAQDGLGARELLRVQAHYGVPDAGAYSFTAYKSDDVISALKQLFHEKCAYCESCFKAVHPVDVEHYRPKGGVFGVPHHRGYWWLAGAWSNLLPSCIDCNRRRYQDLLGEEDEDPAAAVLRALSGKQNLFPIAGAQHASCEDDLLDDEDALLINPCQRDPARHLTWATSAPAQPGTLRAVAVARTSAGGEDVYARTSIDVYGLNRSGLVEKRTDMIRNLEYGLRDLEWSIEQVAGNDATRHESGLLMVDEKISRLMRHMDGTQPYSACAAEFLRSRLVHLLDSLDKLRQECRRAAGDGAGQAASARIDGTLHE